MASNLVIVAIPSDGDDVWKVSSEKKPHLTLLFLGDALSNPNVAKIVDTVKGYSSYLDPFNLLVDHRGFLGEEDADVLFFTDDIPWKLVDFREQLKYNQEISMAYNAIPQHAKWKPHLTLGYPDSPANSDNWDPMGQQYVQFDKVAVWYGDYEGPEFMLTESPKPSDMDSPMALAYADQIGAELAHHGVKGMKWGVRKVTTKASDLRFAGKANASGNISKLVSTAAKATKEKDLPAINEKHKNTAKVSKNVKLIGTSKIPAQQAYRNEVRDAYRKRLEEAANATTSKSGNLKYTITEPSIGSGSAVRWKVKATAVKHADNTDFTIEPVFDKDGFIVDFKLVNDDVAQSAVDEILEHHGIKGMRWGIRRKNPSGPNPVVVSVNRKKLKAKGGEGHPAVEEALRTAAVKQQVKKSGVHSVPSEELQAAVNRMNLESNFSQAAQKTKYESAGAKLVKRTLKRHGERHLDKVVDKGISLGVKAALGAV